MVLAADGLGYNREPFWALAVFAAKTCVLPVFKVVAVPIYEYQCESCSHALEALQRLSDSLLVDCPACGQPTLKKHISAAGFRLKGGGWYETDFKSGNKKNLAGDASAGASAPAASPASTPAVASPAPKAKAAE